MTQLTPGFSYIIKRVKPLLGEDFPAVLTYDQIVVDGGAVSIKDLRGHVQRFYEQPSGDTRLLIVNSAHKLNELLQNTLLKILEEPPSKGVALIQTPSVDSLLPTLRSRLHRLEMLEELEAAASMTDAEIEAQFEGLYQVDRQEAIDKLALIQQSLDPVGAKKYRNHRLLDDVIVRLSKNTNQKLTIDYLTLNWSSELGKE